MNVLPSDDDNNGQVTVNLTRSLTKSVSYLVLNRLVILFSIIFLLLLVPKTKQFEFKGDLSKYSYTNLTETVDSLTLLLSSIVLGIVLLIVNFSVNKHSCSNGLHYVKRLLAISLILHAGSVIGISSIICWIIKYAYAKPRPNVLGAIRLTTGDDKLELLTSDLLINMIRDSTLPHYFYDSFPSGHSTFSAAFGVSLLMGLHLIIRRNNSISKTVYYATVAIVLQYCFIIPFSRLVDKFHHFEDVMFGTFLGSSIALLMHYEYKSEMADTLKKISDFEDRLATTHINV